MSGIAPMRAVAASTRWPAAVPPAARISASGGNGFGDREMQSLCEDLPDGFFDAFSDDAAMIDTFWFRQGYVALGPAEPICGYLSRVRKLCARQLFTALCLDC